MFLHFLWAILTLSVRCSYTSCGMFLHFLWGVLKLPVGCFCTFHGMFFHFLWGVLALPALNSCTSCACPVAQLESAFSNWLFWTVQFFEMCRSNVFEFFSNCAGFEMDGLQIPGGGGVRGSFRSLGVPSRGISHQFKADDKHCVFYRRVHRQAVAVRDRSEVLRTAPFRQLQAGASLPVPNCTVVQVPAEGLHSNTVSLRSNAVVLVSSPVLEQRV